VKKISSDADLLIENVVRCSSSSLPIRHNRSPASVAHLFTDARDGTALGSGWLGHQSFRVIAAASGLVAISRMRAFAETMVDRPLMSSRARAHHGGLKSSGQRLVLCTRPRSGGDR
jgi:hypothetical protein